MEISDAYFRDFLPHLLTELGAPPAEEDWKPMTEEHARRLVAKYPNPNEFWDRAIAYLEEQEAAGASAEWLHQIWCALEDAMGTVT